MPDLALRGITERDIDLLIAEELVATAGFAAWLGHQLGVSQEVQLERVERSVLSATRGESDLVLTFREGAGLLKVFVENKIDAAFQPRQAERYRERADAAVRAGACNRATIAVLAPEAYVGAERGFDAIVRYEQVRRWFADEASGDARSLCKVSLLDAALTRGEKGWTLVPNQAATEFWQSYWTLATELAPELRLPRPGVKPATSAFIRFAPRGLPRGVSLYHKVPYGNVDLQFAGKATQIEEFRRLYRALLEPEMTIETASKSLVIRVVVNTIPLGTSFDTARPTVQSALREATRLLAWYKRVFESGAVA